MTTISVPSKFCPLCLEKITSKNKTEEHIIPNSIGGRLIIKDFICKPCNDQGGDDWDAALAAQFNWFSLIVGVKRQRGKTPRQLIETVNGKRLFLHADGKMTLEHPVYEKVDDGNQTQINIQARTLEEAKDILKKNAKKYSNFDKDKALQEAKITKVPLDSLIKINLVYGGPLFGRSLVKTAFAFASKANIPHKLCDEAINYLKNLVDESKAPYGFFYLRDLVRNRPDNKLFHCVAVLGDPQKRRLIAYVEYFGLARFIVNLSSDYSGKRIKSIYALDPTSGLQIDINVDLDLTDTELQLVLKDDAIPNDEYMKAVDYALSIAIGQSFERHKNKAIEDAFIYAFEGLGVKPGGFVAVEDSHKFSQLFTEKLMPFLVSNMKQNRELLKFRQKAATKNID